MSFALQEEEEDVPPSGLAVFSLRMGEINSQPQRCETAAREARRGARGGRACVMLPPRLLPASHQFWFSWLSEPDVSQQIGGWRAGLLFSRTRTGWRIDWAEIL